MTEVTETEIPSSAGLEISPALGSVCAALGGVLSSGADVHRCQAAKALGRIGAPGSAAPLITALLDEDEDVRTDAAEALLALADPKAGEQLFENLLGDPCTEVKLAAIQTLAKLQDDRVVPWLRRMLKGRDEDIVWDEEEFFVSGWDDWVEIQIGAIKALAELQDTAAIPEIVAAICDEDAHDIVEPALMALAKMDPGGVEALAGLLDQSATRLRRRAAAVLAGIDTELARKSLARALGDPSAEVRLAALRGRCERFPGDPALAMLLEDADAGVRGLAVRKIGRFHRGALRARLVDSSAKVQAAALAVYAEIGGADASLVETLCGKTNSAELEVSVAAITALGVVAPEVAWGVLTELLSDLKQPLTIRIAALRGLAAIGGEDVMAALVDVIDDDKRQIRLEAMTGLAKLAAAAEWPNIAGTALLAALAGKYEPESEAPAEDHAAGAAEEASADDGANEPEDAGPAVAKPKKFPTSTLDSILEEVPGIASAAGLPDQGIELTQNDMERLAMARRVIGKKKMATEPKVVRHDDIRRFAARVLGDLDHGEVTTELAVSLELDDTEMSVTAADSLARIGVRGNGLPVEVTQVLLDKLTTEDRSFKLALIRALASGDDEEVFDPLQLQLSHADSFVRNEAVRALAGRDRLGPSIEGLLVDPDPSVRMSAAEALARTEEAGKIPRLVEFATSFEGYHGRQTARLLRDMDADRASAAFLNILNDPERRRVCSVAIEALEELNR